MDKSELAIVLADQTKFNAPNFVDDELAQLVAARGAKQPLFDLRVFFSFFAIMVCVGFVCGLLNVSVWPVLGAILAFNLAVAYLYTQRITGAYKRRQYDLVGKLLPTAIRWCCASVPFSGGALGKCLSMQSEILIAEGRLLELEVMSRFSWASKERTAATESIPKIGPVANNLAVSWLMQGKFAQAAEIFASALAPPVGEKNRRPVKIDDRHRLVLLNNLAYCQCQNGQFDETEQNLDEAFKLLQSHPDSPVGPRLRYIRALLEFERGRLDMANTAVEEAIHIVQSKGFPAALRGQFTILLARIRHKQGRLDEAELHFHNGIDILATDENPDYVALAKCHQYMAQMLCELDKIALASQALDKAQRYFDFYKDRETATALKLKARLGDSAKISSTFELLTLSHRERLLEARGS